MGAENDKVKLHQPKEIQKNQRNIDIKDTIDSVFSTAPKINISISEKEEIEKVLKDSELNFSKEQTKTFLKNRQKLFLIESKSLLISQLRKWVWLLL